MAQIRYFIFKVNKSFVYLSSEIVRVKNHYVMKILNLYPGVGGNAAHWDDNLHEITNVELEPKIANLLQRLKPKQTVIIADAHQYLLDHYKEFDFIWSSPPCQTHSKMNKFTRHNTIRYLMVNYSRKYYF